MIFFNNSVKPSTVLKTFTSILKTCLKREKKTACLIRILQNNLPRALSVTVHKLFVRLYLDYGNILCQCFFDLGKKCKFEISENQFFYPKIVIFSFYRIKLRTKTGLVALWNITSLRRAILDSIFRKGLSCVFSFWEVAKTFF